MYYIWTNSKARQEKDQRDLDVNGADGFKRNISRKTHYLILDEVYKQFQFGKQRYLEMNV